MDIKSVKGTIPVNMPGSRFPIKAEVTSDVVDGLTVKLPPGAPTFGLHRMIIEGDLIAVNFTYKEATPNKEND